LPNLAQSGPSLESGTSKCKIPAVQRASLIIRSLWAACLLIAAVNHARILLQHGLLWDYGGAGWPSAIYWSSLAIVDPLAATLLFARPRLGIVCTIVVIVTNVLHNLAVTAFYAPDGEFLARASHPFVIAQIGFMMFVAATGRIAWRGSGAAGFHIRFRLHSRCGDRRPQPITTSVRQPD
jgi:hypothetical protein